MKNKTSGYFFPVILIKGSSFAKNKEWALLNLTLLYIILNPLSTYISDNVALIAEVSTLQDYKCGEDRKKIHLSLEMEKRPDF